MDVGAGLDLDLVISDEADLTIPAADLARLPALPGQRVRVHIERAPVRPRSLLGALANPGRPSMTIEDFEDLSDEMWTGTDHGNDGHR